MPLPKQDRMVDNKAAISLIPTPPFVGPKDSQNCLKPGVNFSAWWDLWCAFGFAPKVVGRVFVLGMPRSRKRTRRTPRRKRRPQRTPAGAVQAPLPPPVLSSVVAFYVNLKEYYYY